MSSAPAKPVDGKINYLVYYYLGLVQEIMIQYVAVMT